ncbi:Protein CBG03722 [Caenorhabditis briggsae]|uniref:Transthyretin-like family protein n=2 Tax=Caenorhabditis briggsae TaxID=6238 RepID=A0AAE9J2P6_CAEBR|nr:Protein CBG03722 [Caenorhabditis briggsae]ULU10987.1 hypothetical protein L3Y34_014891 [Caenorhabditis briggsae]UMM11944.1 hypothetical protein L5515_000968 [Caenorhabditis briggsae]CAP24568.2 Protein CBG03722 [Caenorhabditis briggsae]
MRGPISLLLLVCTYFMVADADDQFFFNVKLTCDARPKFSYNLRFFEQDYWWGNGDDPITAQRIGDGRGTAEFVQNGWQNGDEAWSTGYDVIMVLYHDCHESGKEKKLTLHIKPQCEFGKGACRYTIIKDIKEAEGEEDYHAKLSYE